MLHKNPLVNEILMRYRDENGVVTLPHEALTEINEITEQDPRRFSSNDPLPGESKKIIEEESSE